MNDTLFPLRPGGAAAVPFTICSVRAGFRVKYFLHNDSHASGNYFMPAVAYKERPQPNCLKKRESGHATSLRRD